MTTSSSAKATYSVWNFLGMALLFIMAEQSEGVLPHSAEAESQPAASRVAVVEDVVGIASLKVTLDGQLEVVNVAHLAGEADLRTSLESARAAGQQGEAVISAADVARFLKNRELIRNFFRCLTPPGSRVARAPSAEKHRGY